LSLAFSDGVKGALEADPRRWGFLGNRTQVFASSRSVAPCTSSVQFALLPRYERDHAGDGLRLTGATVFLDSEGSGLGARTAQQTLAVLSMMDSSGDAPDVRRRCDAEQPPVR
jgi:hypothetical protein